MNNFENLRKEVINSIINFSKINDLPKKIVSSNNETKSNFYDEEIIVKKLDYYYTNSISRASKTMSECRQVSQDFKKTGTNN